MSYFPNQSNASRKKGDAYHCSSVVARAKNQPKGCRLFFARKRKMLIHDLRSLNRVPARSKTSAISALADCCEASGRWQEPSCSSVYFRVSVLNVTTLSVAV